MHRAFMNEPRRPREDIPSDYICTEPYCGAGPFKSEQAFIGHMSGKHRVKYELKNPELSATLKRLKAIKPNTAMKPWHRHAIAQHVVYDTPWTQIAKDFKKNYDTLREVIKTPEAQAFIVHVEEQLSNPETLVRNLMSSGSVNMYLDWLMSFEWAKENKDYDAVHRMVKDLGLKGIIGDESAQVPTSITINLAGTDLASGGGSTSHEVILEAKEWDANEDIE